mgnify:CR=1 FL=1
MLNIDALACGDDYFCKDYYRYAPIEYFTTLADVYHAMEIAKEDLEIKCDIIVREDGSIEIKDEEEDTYVPGRRDDDDFFFTDDAADFVEAGYSLKGESDDDDLSLDDMEEPDEDMVMSAELFGEDD